MIKKKDGFVLRNLGAGGFTMVELMIVVALLAVTLAGVLAIFNYSGSLSELSGSTAIASNEAQFQMEALRSQDYAVLRANFTNNGALGESLFNLQSVALQRGIGTIYAEELVANELIRIKVVVSWTQKGRVMGEDSNLNGRLDGGEDLNGNGELDSPAQMESVAVNRAF